MVLVVEDNPDHAVLVQMAASRARADLDVRVLSSGEAALAYLGGDGAYADRAAHPLPDLVILDLLLPGMGGFDVLTWMGDRPELAQAIPVVVLTSSMNPDDRGKSMELGASDFFTKPPDLDGLGSTIRRILEVWLS